MARGRARRPKAVPWSKFNRDAYPEPALALALHEMSALALGEYMAVDQFARIASALALNGVPLDLVAAAAEIPGDEIRHSDHALRFASLLANEEISLPLAKPPYEKAFSRKVDLGRLDLMMVELPTIAETLAAALLRACGEGATDPVAKAVFGSILSDEVHHLRLGWYYLAWRAKSWTLAEQQRVADHAGNVIIEIERQFWVGRDAPRGAKKAASLPRLASPQARPRMKFPFRALGRALDQRERAAVVRRARSLLQWQERLRGWPGVSRAPLPDATPFVSLYATGRLRGCFGSVEGDAEERLSRAFLLALGDVRFGGIGIEERRHLAMEIAYPIRATRVSAAEFSHRFEIGAQGVAFAHPERPGVLVLPNVPRDEALPAERVLELVARKAGVGDLADGTLFLVEMESVTVRRRESVRSRREPVDLAAEWLAARVAADGAVAFGVDPRSGIEVERGPFHHGRAAIAVRALAEHGGHPGVTARARAWLDREARAALAGRRVAGWPTDPAEVAGTLALAALAGAPVQDMLREASKHPALAKNAWHAAQVVCALGEQAPAALMKTCARDLRARPWAPWTAIAARRVGDSRVLERSEKALVDSIRARAPHSGGVNVVPIPELALTAVVAEALADSRRGRGATRRATEFLLRWQLRTGHVPAAFDPAKCCGAFPLSPVMPHLRVDVTAHALRALLAAVATRRPPR